MSREENNISITENISISDFLRRERVSLDQEIMKSNNVILVPRHKTADDVIIIKKLRQHGAKVYYPTHGLYIEARAGLWEISLMFIKDFATGILIALLIDWITSKVKEYRELRREEPFSDVKQPVFKVRLYFIKEQKYVEISGDEEHIGKILKSLNHE